MLQPVEASPRRSSDRRAPRYSSGRAGVDLTAGAQAPQMRAVAVMDFRLLEILLPFHDPAVGVDAGRGQTLTRRVQALGELLVDPQDAGRRGRVLQQIASDLLVEGRTDAQRGRLPLAAGIRVGVAVLRRVGGDVTSQCVSGSSTSTACMNLAAPRRMG